MTNERGRRTIVRPIVVVVASIAIGAGCGASSSKGTPARAAGAAAIVGTNDRASATTTPTSALPTTSVPPLGTDADLVEMAITQPAELTRDWTYLGDEVLVGDRLNNPADACDPTGLFSHHTAGRQREWAYLLAPDGTEGGHVSVIVKAARTPAIVTQQLAHYSSEAFAPCEAQGIESDLHRAGVTITGHTTWSPLPKTLPVPGGAERFVTFYNFRGDAKVMYTDLIWLGVGRLRQLIEPHACCKFPSAALEDALIASAATRLRALQNR